MHACMHIFFWLSYDRKRPGQLYCKLNVCLRVDVVMRSFSLHDRLCPGLVELLLRLYMHPEHGEHNRMRSCNQNRGGELTAPTDWGICVVESCKSEGLVTLWVFYIRIATRDRCGRFIRANAVGSLTT